MILAIFAMWAMVPSLVAMVMPQLVAKAALGKILVASSLPWAMEVAGPRLGLGIVALVAARVRRPPASLVMAVALALLMTHLGVGLTTAMGTLPAADRLPHDLWLKIDGFFALALLLTMALRLFRGKKQA